jgi:hypothetical protein
MEETGEPEESHRSVDLTNLISHNVVLCISHYNRLVAERSVKDMNPDIPPNGMSLYFNVSASFL